MAYGGGGCANGTSCGISNWGAKSDGIVDVIACEPETAAPFAASRLKGEITQIDYRQAGWNIHPSSGLVDFYKVTHKEWS